MKYFTIIAQNYSAQAHAMASSLKSHSPDADIDVWVIDDINLSLRKDCCNTIPISKAIDDSEFYRLALKYTILELSTATKPYILKYYLQTEKQEAIVYLDPDLYFCQSIEYIITKGLTDYDYLLTPHTSSPLPNDDKHPNDLDLLKSGTFNLGFVAIRNTQPMREFVDWWLDHLSENCWANPETGVFTDQKWINLAITYWPNFKSLTEPGLNVAYWNLHERKISYTKNCYAVNDAPLYFFHFSGFNPQTLKLSKHENRIGVLRQGTELFELATEYKNNLLKFDYNEAIKKKVSIINFSNGAGLDAVTSLAARSYIKEKNGPFNLEEFYSWLTNINDNFLDIKYVDFFLKLRLDLRKSFESIGKFDADHIINWLKEGGAEDSNLDKTTLTEIGVYSLPSLCYLGYVNAMSGVGDATRQNIASLKRQRYPTAIEDISLDTIFDVESSIEKSDFNPLEAEIVIAHVNADMLPQVYKNKKQFFGKYTVAYMAWETAFFPSEWKNRDQYCDEIWVPSSFAKNAIEKVMDIPVFVVPHPLSLPSKYLPDSSRKDIAVKKGIFRYLVSFDACSDVERKNPHSAILAFKEAFNNQESVKLIIKISNADRCGENLAKIHDLICDHKNIEVISKNLSKDDYLELMKSIDVYVSLHRGEGFGLNIQQAMAMGKPVIVTNYGGNTDYCFAENSVLIDYKIVSINIGQSQYPHYTMWAEPDVSQASRAMKKLFADPDFRAQIGRNASTYILANHSPKKIGSIMQRRLQRIAMRLNSYKLRTTSKSYIDEIDDSSPDFAINCIFESILGRPASANDINFYMSTFDKYGIERVFRDVLISNEGSKRMNIPKTIKTLLSFFWSPSTTL